VRRGKPIRNVPQNRLVCVEQLINVTVGARGTTQITVLEKTTYLVTVNCSPTTHNSLDNCGRVIDDRQTASHESMVGYRAAGSTDTDCSRSAENVSTRSRVCPARSYDLSARRCNADACACVCISVGVRRFHGAKPEHSDDQRSYHES